MADYAPIFSGNQLPFTSTASATITGGELVEVSGSGTVAPASADSTVVVGVAAHDAASAARVTVYPLAGVVHELVADEGGVTAGDLVKVGADASTVIGLEAEDELDVRVGVALTTASAESKVQVLGR